MALNSFYLSWKSWMCHSKYQVFVARSHALFSPNFNRVFSLLQSPRPWGPNPEQAQSCGVHSYQLLLATGSHSRTLFLSNLSEPLPDCPASSAESPYLWLHLLNPRKENPISLWFWNAHRFPWSVLPISTVFLSNKASPYIQISFPLTPDFWALVLPSAKRRNKEGKQCFHSPFPVCGVMDTKHSCSVSNLKWKDTHSSRN